MNILRKKSLIEVTGGSPAIAGNPGSPGRAGYYRTDTYTVKTPVYGWVTTFVGQGSTLGTSEYKLIGYETSTTTTKTWIPEVPAIPPTPAVAAVPPTTTELNVGWNGGANTVGRASGNVAFSFQIPKSSVGVAVGLSNTPAEGDYRLIKHGVYTSKGKLSFVEDGAIIGPPTDYTEGSTITVSRAGPTVSYIVGDSAVRTTDSTLPAEVFGTAALYMAGDSVVDASFGAASAVSKGTMLPMTAEAYAGVYAQSLNDMLPMTGAATGRRYDGIHATMLPMAALASNRPSGESRTHMLALQGDATGRQFTSASKATMQPMVGMGADKIYAASDTAMLPIEGLANDGLLMPEIAISLTSMSYLLGAAHGITGEVGTSNASMSPLRKGLSANRPYGESTASFAPMTGQAGLFVLLEGQADLAAPPPTLRANGQSSLGDNSFTYRAPMATLSAFGGGNAKLRAPAAGLSASATGTNWGNVAIEAPSATLSATGTTSATASASLRAPIAALVGYTGAVCSITLTGRAQLLASGTTGASGVARLTVPLFTLTASATAQNYGGANLLAPSPKLGGQAQAWLIAPVGRLEAIGTATITATFDAYATNLLHRPREGLPTVDEVTRYTNFPFTHVVRHQNSYFGANSTGLYLLEGTTDDGAPIAYDLQTQPDTLGHTGMKTAVSAYLSGRIDPELTAKVVAGEDNPQTYSYDSPRGATAQTHRVKFGRGVKDRYLAFGLAGEGALELDGIELEVSNLKRRI